MITEKNIFNTEKYRIVAEYLMEYGLENNGFAIRRLYLANELVHDHKKPYSKEHFSFLPTLERMEKRLKLAYDIGLISEESKYKKAESALDFFKKEVKKKNKPFKSKKSLDKHIDKLKKLKLVTSYNPKKGSKKGYSCLALTDKGSILLLKYSLKDFIEKINDKKTLLAINMYAMDLVLKNLKLEKQLENK